MKKPTSSSGNYPGSSNSKANDGNTDGNYNAGSVYHSGNGTLNNDGSAQFWEVDLGDTQTIDRIIISNRTDCCKDRLNNWLLTIYDNNKTLSWARIYKDHPNPKVIIDIKASENDKNNIRIKDYSQSRFNNYFYRVSDTEYSSKGQQTGCNEKCHKEICEGEKKKWIGNSNFGCRDYKPGEWEAENYKFDSFDSILIKDKHKKKFLEELFHFNGEYWGDVNTKLLYRGSRDGFSAEAFHAKCDNQGPTLTILRAPNGRIAGGFLPYSWRSTSYSVSLETYKHLEDNYPFLFRVSEEDAKSYKSYKEYNGGFTNEWGLTYYPLSFFKTNGEYACDRYHYIRGRDEQYSYEATCSVRKVFRMYGNDRNYGDDNISFGLDLSIKFINGSAKGNSNPTIYHGLGEEEYINFWNRGQEFVKYNWKLFGSPDFNINEIEVFAIKPNKRLLSPILYKQIVFLRFSENSGNRPFLLYRASRDGFSTEAFHNNVFNVKNHLNYNWAYYRQHNIGDTKYIWAGAAIVIIKATNGRVAGGCFPMRWDPEIKKQHLYLPDWGGYFDRIDYFHTYLFSVSGDKVTRYNHSSRKIQKTNAKFYFYMNDEYGPTWGDPKFSGGFDLHISNNSNANENSYTNSSGSFDLPSDTALFGSKYFKVSEIEVWNISGATDLHYRYYQTAWSWDDVNKKWK
jgi:hypothetical protein